ncbi:MAG TPA: hypothetical protein VKU92_12650 [Acidimicrobiales bacterium]|nr:hypothetical protein [Acidimicrobiales bacterium]
MLNDLVSVVADHEARNECLIEIDETWELCRDSIDAARVALEESLEAARAAYEQEQRRIADSHEGALAEAWGAYKGVINGPPAPNRRELISEAREAYKRAAEEIRAAYSKEMSEAGATYASARTSARAAYNTAVEEAFTLHREAVRDVRGFFAGEGTAGSGAHDLDGDGDADPLELAAVLAARESERQAGASEGDPGAELAKLGEEMFLTESPAS